MRQTKKRNKTGNKKIKNNTNKQIKYNNVLIEDKETISSQEKKARKSKKTKNVAAEPAPKKHPFLKKFIVIFILCLIIFLAFLTYNAYIFKNLAKEMFNNTPSKVYDINHNIIGQVGIERHRENIAFSNIPSQLVNAYISIEDQRFYTHHGIDIKRTGAAILSYVSNGGSSSFGGSSITQQLVKNITGDDSNSIKRKVKEWFYAIVMDFSFSKEEILEAYLNIIYTGPNVYGVQEASHYYFNTDVQNLSLAKLAFLAGINNAPNSYNPFSEKDRSEKIVKRTKTVLKKMLELNYISQTEFDDAILEVENGLKFEKGQLTNTSYIYSYHTDALINEVVSDISKSKHISKEFATNYLYLSGSNIYSTQNSEIQEIVNNELKKEKYILYSSNGQDTSQAAIIIIDHSTGQVIACGGGLGQKTTSRAFNRATQMVRQTGSAMKPIAVLLPAFAENLITNVTTFDDVPTTFIDYNGKSYSPVNYDGYKGNITLRQAVETSQNIPFVKIIEQLTPQVSINYLQKLGLTTLNDNDINLSLSLGGLDKGISPLEFAGAYSAIANDGTYIEPTFYTKITSNTSNTEIFTSKQKNRRVITKEVSYILKQLLTEPVTRKQWNSYLCLYS